MRKLFWVYILGFIFAFHAALPAYVNSSFLGSLVSENSIGLVYIIAYILTAFGFLVMPFILARFGNYRTTLFFTAANLIALLGLVFLKTAPWGLVFFVVNLVTVSLIYFLTDIFLEGFSRNENTGTVRGIYLTSMNLAWAVSPFISGLILSFSHDNYLQVYFASSLLLLPIFLILFLNLRSFQDSKYVTLPVLQTVKEIWKNKNIFRILSANFLLYFFYSWMTIYAPIYLHDNIGFSWGEIGIIFSIMLLPFVIFQSPLGFLADRKWGEKEILSVGFIIMAIATGGMSFVAGQNIWLWSAVLFLTRVGACMVEVMSDTYFFKKADSLDANIISFYRLSGTMAYILAPLVATLIFSFTTLDFKYLFLILGVFMLFGLKTSLPLRDTK